MVGQPGASTGGSHSFRSGVGSVLTEAGYQLFPFPRLLKFNRIVRATRNVPDEREAKWAALGRDKLLPILADEWERAKLIDDKLFKLTTALSLAVAAVGVASKAVLDVLPQGLVKTAVMGVLLYAILCLFAGTLMGFSGLRPKPRAGYGPDFALQIRHENKSAAAHIADALMDFEKANILRANEASAANMAIRNGVIAFAMAMTFSLFLPPKTVATKPTARQTVHISLHVSQTPPLDARPASLATRDQGGRGPAAPHSRVVIEDTIDPHGADLKAGARLAISGSPSPAGRTGQTTGPDGASGQ